MEKAKTLSDAEYNARLAKARAEIAEADVRLTRAALKKAIEHGRTSREGLGEATAKCSAPNGRKEAHGGGNAANLAAQAVRRARLGQQELSSHKRPRASKSKETAKAVSLGHLAPQSLLDNNEAELLVAGNCGRGGDGETTGGNSYCQRLPGSSSQIGGTTEFVVTYELVMTTDVAPLASAASFACIDGRVPR